MKIMNNYKENKKKELLNGLDDRQKECLIKSLNKNSLVLAGAGSGKTRLLTTRLSYIMDVLDIHPSQIICFTFTKKAATEMSERMKKITDCEDSHLMWIGTYHSVCLKIISKYYKHLGFEENYSILDPYNSRKKITSIMQTLGYGDEKEEVNIMIKKISDFKNNLISPSKVYDRLCEKYKNNINGVIYDANYSFYQIYKTYCDECYSNNTLDFDDIIVKTIEILSSCYEAQDFVRRNFRYILADEVQDSNPANIMLLALLGGNANVFMVGDLNQSIYGWRGARPDLIMSFVNKNNMQILKLEQNYRSTQTIVNASNALISHNDTKVEMNCFSNNPIGDKIVYNSLTTNIDEAKYVSAKILEMINKGYKYSDIMILYRTNSQSRVLEEILMKFSIPYHIHGSTSFVTRAEVKDCLSFLRLVSNSKDKESFRRSLMTLAGVGYSFTKEILNLFDVYGCAKMTLQNYRAKTVKAQNSLEFLLGLFGIPNNESLLDTLMHKVANYQLERLSSINGEDVIDKMSNIHELVKLCTEKTTSEKMSLNDFLRFMDVLAQEGTNEEKKDAVKMMTMHSSKGLESPVVFIIGMNEGILPHANSIRDKDPIKVEQERQLAYVACTRAEKELIITRFSFDTKNSYASSRFIGELPFSLVESVDLFEKDESFGDELLDSISELEIKKDSVFY